MSTPALPLSLRNNPRLDRWVRFDAGGTVTVFSGKVELGQGIVTAIAQIAAEELVIALDRLAIIAGDTTVAPDEWYTAGSQSIEVGGAAMRLACAEVRQLFLEHAARRFEVDPEQLQLRDGVFELPGTDLTASYWDLASQVSLARDATGSGRAEARLAARRRRPERAAARHPAQARGRRLRARHGAARDAARAHGAPVRLRCRARSARREGDQSASGRRRRGAQRQLRRRRRRTRGAGSEGR
jgi:hypothetical protein